MEKTKTLSTGKTERMHHAHAPLKLYFYCHALNPNKIVSFLFLFCFEFLVQFILMLLSMLFA